MNWLSEHCAQQKEGARARKARTSPRDMDKRLAEAEPPRPFRQALKEGTGPAVIAEIKFRSPSQGELRSSRDVEAIARSYATHGASALSVLIDEVHFAGSLDYLSRAKSACTLPALAKGFLVDPFEVMEARACGADAVLLIAACLERDELVTMLETAQDLGMDALVELHSEADFQKVEDLPLALVGVNHRDLATLAMDMDLSRRLQPKLPAQAVKVAESGLSTPEDLARMKALGYDAVLVGTGFMRDPEPGRALGRLLAPMAGASR